MEALKGTPSGEMQKGNRAVIWPRPTGRALALLTLDAMVQTGDQADDALHPHQRYDSITLSLASIPCIA